MRASSGSPKICWVVPYSTSTPVRVSLSGLTSSRWRLVLAQGREIGQLGPARDVLFILFHSHPSAAFGQGIPLPA